MSETPRKFEDMAEPDLRLLLNMMGTQVLSVAEWYRVEKPLFALVVFNDPALGQYVSNANRADIVKALRETADRLEKREGVPR